jgi:hypothetical protein
VKLLLDECVDQRLAKELQGHVVETVQWMGWAGIKNGQLLTLAEKQFDVLITVDRNLPFQQNLSKFMIAVLIVCAPTNRLVDLKPLVPNILAALPSVKIGQATRVGNC